MGNITGGDFRSWVTKQITVRQQKLGVLNKDADNLTWQTNSTAWLRLCSAVNITSEKSTELTGDTSYAGSTLAKKYVLFGGVNGDSSYYSPKEGVLGKSSDSSYSFSGGDSYSSAYGFNSSAENRGLIPMPGLESATVTPLNRGALKKAQIKIKCHSKEQFAILDALYMRPGYTILLEWGHTMYFDNEGNLVKTPEWNTPAYETLTNRSGDQDDILGQIDKERSSSDGNYDGFYGKITNFNWAFNADGSYDITVNAISIGDVIETLNINNADFKPASDASKENPNNEEEEEKDINFGSSPQFIVDKNKSKLNNWLYFLFNIAGKRKKQGVTTTTGFSSSNNTKYTLDFAKLYFKKSFTGGKLRREVIRINNKLGWVPSLSSDKEDEITYVRLGAILRYIEKYLLFYNEKGKSYLNIDWDYDSNYCFTFPEHYSIDPSICVIPFEQPFTKNGVYKHGKYGKIWHNILGGAFRDTKSRFVGKLMAIHVNLNHVSNCISNNLVEGQIALLPFLEELMGGIQRALGDINKFSVTYDSETNYIKVIDEIPLDPKVTGIKDNIALFNTYGVKENVAGSFVTNITLNATISNEFATMISIGAQARNDGKKANTSTLTTFNKGLIDGITPQKLVKEVADSKQEDIKTFEETYDGSYKKIFKNGSILFEFYWKNKRPSQDAIEAEYSIISELFRTLAAYYNKKNNVGGVEGFLPFNLGLEMKGISGPRIYERFFITGEILPNSYPNSLAFLVKGLQHDINVSGWKTTIDSMAYQSTGEYVTLPETTEVGSGGNIPSGDGGQNDPNAEYKTITSGYTIENGVNGPFYFANKTSEKTQITIHYTAGGPNPRNTISWWNTLHGQNGFHISTHYVIGGDGFVEQVFPLENYANHTGVGGRAKNKFNVGIEMNNYGFGYPERWLDKEDPSTYATLIDKNGKVIESWRGKEFYQPLSKGQIQGLKKTLLEIKSSYPDIPLTFDYDKCFPGDGTYSPAYKKLEPGVYTHNSFKPKGEKWDVPPQKELIEMLKTLS
jgi:hypothetical protein